MKERERFDTQIVKTVFGSGHVGLYKGRLGNHKDLTSIIYFIWFGGRFVTTFILKQTKSTNLNVMQRKTQNWKNG